MIGYAFGEVFVEFLSSLKASCYSSPTGVVATKLLLNSPCMDLVGVVSEDFLYTEPSMYIIPGNELLIDNVDMEEARNRASSIISKCMAYLYFYDYLVNNEIRFVFDCDICDLKNHDITMDVIKKNTIRIIRGCNLEIASLSPVEVRYYRKLHVYSCAYIYYLSIIFQNYQEKTRPILEKQNTFISIITKRIDYIVVFS